MQADTERVGRQADRARRAHRRGLWTTLALLATLAWAPAMAAAEGSPGPSKIAVIFLETVARKSSQWTDIMKVAQDTRGRMQQLAQAMHQVDADRINLEKSMSLGVGDQQEMQTRWLKVMQQKFKLASDAKQLQATSSDQINRMLAALMVDINRAIEQIALREKIDVVINRKDAELAATERKKLRDELLDKTRTDEGEDGGAKDDKPETLDREMYQQMASKLENTFVYSNDSMDITEAVVAQINQDYKDSKFTNWRDMPAAGDDKGGAPGGGAGNP